MVIEYGVYREHSECLAVITRKIISHNLGAGVRALGIKRRALCLSFSIRQAKHIGSTRLKIAHILINLTDDF